MKLDKVIAITGASSGIGRAVAEQAAAAGAAVVLCARRADMLREAAAAIAAKGGRVITVTGDVTSAADMQSLVEQSVEAFGRLDVMICNAGIGFHDTFAGTPLEVMRRLVDVNLMGALYAAHAAMTPFRAQQSGHIIAISSVVGRRGVAGSSVYGATKSALVSLIEAIRSEHYGTNIHASIVYPVRTATEFRAAIKRDFSQDVHGDGPSQSAEDVARTIVDCIRHPRAEVYPYRPAWYLAIVGIIAPSLADRIVQKYGRSAASSSDAGHSS